MVTAAGTASFRVKGTHTYMKSKKFTVQVIVTDAGGAIATTTTPAATLVVSALSFTAHKGVTFGGNVAKFVDLSFADPNCGFASYTPTISWGDGVSSVGSVLFGGTCAAGFTVGASHTYAVTGTYTVAVKVSSNDGAGGQATGKSTP